MNENAERINGLAAMMGIIAAMGAYATHNGQRSFPYLVIPSMGLLATELLSLAFAIDLFGTL